VCTAFQERIGSIEVYDHKQQKWVPYKPDPQKWYQNFKDVRDGYVKPDHKGWYIVGSGKHHQRALVKMKRQTPVTTVAQATEIAISEVKRKNATEASDKRKKGSLKRKNTNVLQYRTSTKRERPNFIDFEFQY
jgi:hypothetical protein